MNNSSKNNGLDAGTWSRRMFGSTRRTKTQRVRDVVNVVVAFTSRARRGVVAAGRCFRPKCVCMFMMGGVCLRCWFGVSVFCVFCSEMECAVSECSEEQ